MVYILDFLCSTVDAFKGPNMSYKCGVPHLAYPYLQTPSFIIESISDIVILCGFEGVYMYPVSPEPFLYFSEYSSDSLIPYLFPH